ncbi:3',5'-cyclic-AMP phosphodiesterase [Gallaecimonas sp. GXIMD4217]|uniref:3',5'-cyclic-AMP phosphodiesterase n=1 Tax=Gallaecimonas sp. GXIMD4217 TaxID=3131927 RepID=UPI00311AE0D9
MKIQDFPHSQDDWQLAVLTDPHLFRDPDACLLGVPTQASFDACLEAMDGDGGRQDCLLLTGDLAQDHNPETYRRLGRQLAARPEPWFWIPGNHDDASAMVEELGAPVRCLKGRHWQLVLLHSQVPGKTFGELGEEELALLEACLADDSRHTLVVLHHHPLSLDSRWLDQHILHDGQALLARLARHDKACAVLFGHVHQEVDSMVQGVRLLATPATCVQFQAGSQDFALAELGPGYRRLCLKADGTIATTVHRLPAERFPVDASAGGY